MGESGQRREQIRGNCGFKWRVLGLQLTNLDKNLDKHTLGDEERHSLRAAGPPALSAALRDLSPEKVNI